MVMMIVLGTSVATAYKITAAAKMISVSLSFSTLVMEVTMTRKATKITCHARLSETSTASLATTTTTTLARRFSRTRMNLILSVKRKEVRQRRPGPIFYQ